MRRWMMVACLALPLAGCGGYADYGYGAHYGPPVAYDGFYDDYYGPIYDGYWGGGGTFFYRTSNRGGWREDRGGHFRHDAGPGPGGPGPGSRGPGPGGLRPGGSQGFHAFHGNGPGPRMGGGGGRGHR